MPRLRNADPRTLSLFQSFVLLGPITWGGARPAAAGLTLPQAVIFGAFSASQKNEPTLLKYSISISRNSEI